MKKAFVNSLHKSGTNLVNKCLQLFGYEHKGHIGSAVRIGADRYARLKWFTWLTRWQGYLVGIDSPIEVSRARVDKILNGLGPGMFVTAHVGYTMDILDKVLQMDFLPIVMTRDPRAVLSSFVHYVRKEKTHVMHRTFSNMSIEDCYIAALKGKTFDGHSSLQPMYVNCMAMHPWLNSERVLHLTFEDLVGSKGGGSDSQQTKTLEKICKNLVIPANKIDKVSQELFGPGRHTFRKGHIDSWRDEIPPSIIQMVNAELNDILKAWGYF